MAKMFLLVLVQVLVGTLLSILLQLSVSQLIFNRSQLASENGRSIMMFLPTKPHLSNGRSILMFDR